MNANEENIDLAEVAERVKNGKGMIIATANTDLCAVYRWRAEEAMLDAARARWQREAQAAHA